MVDDAIVVVESVEHIMETEKLSAYEATKKAMEGLTSALIATSLVLCAVFVPKRNYRTTLPAVYHNDCRVGINLYCGCTYAQPCHVFSDSETG